MASADEDWETFLKSTQEASEEVDTDDESEDENEEEDSDNKDDLKKKSDKDEAGEGDANDEVDKTKKTDESKVDKTKEDGEPYKPRLKQFFNDDGSLNAERIEKAYIETSKEGVRLNGEFKGLTDKYNQLVEVIKAKPEIAKVIFGEGDKTNQETNDDQPADPILAHVSAQMRNNQKKEYDEFVDQHPEATTDPDKVQKIGTFLKTYGAVYREEHGGEIPTMKDGLEAAYRFYGWDLEIKNAEDVASAAKKAAATRRTPQAQKSGSKDSQSAQEQFFAKKLGVKL